MIKILGASWTKVGTAVSLGVAILSMPELGSLVPPDYMPGILIGLNILMGLKKWLAPSENFQGAT